MKDMIDDMNDENFDRNITVNEAQSRDRRGIGDDGYRNSCGFSRDDCGYGDCGCCEGGYNRNGEA